jgi:hypothetical protein
MRLTTENGSWRTRPTYYVTDSYRPYHPVVLVRLAHLDRDALHDLLTVRGV